MLKNIMNVHNPEKKGLFLGSSSFEVFHLTLRVIVYDNLTKLPRKTTVYRIPIAHSLFALTIAKLKYPVLASAYIHVCPYLIMSRLKSNNKMSK